MIALQENRTGLVYLIIDFTAGGLVAFDVIMDFDPIHDNGDPIADHGRLGCLPLAGGLGDELVRSFEIVDGTVAANGWLAALVIAEDLNFMAAAQVKAAVGIVRRHILVPDCEIPKLLFRHQVSPMCSLFDRILENAAGQDAPRIVAVGVSQFPARHVLPVEQRLEILFIVGSGKAQATRNNQDSESE
jgi:hypothetical protein